MSLLLRRHYIQEEQISQYSDLENKTLEELKNLAKEAGIAGAYKLSKAEIVEVLEEDFYDWESNVKRLAGEELEITEERYAELANNFASNGVAISDVLEEILPEPGFLEED